MFPNWLGIVSSEQSTSCFSILNLRMHCTKDVGNHQSPSAGFGVELDVLAIRGGSNTVKSDRTLDCGVNALHCDADDAPLVVR